MVTVRATQDSNNRQIKLEATGHAGQAQLGQDIVCSAISILVYTFANVFSIMATNGYFDEPPVISVEGGDAVINAVCRDDETYIDALHMLFFAKTGFSMLQAKYPEYIKFIVNEA